MFWFFFSLRVDRIQNMNVVTGNVREEHFLLKSEGAFSKPSFVYTHYIMKKATEPASFMYDIHNNFCHRLASHAFSRRSGTQEEKNGFNTVKMAKIKMFKISIKIIEISTEMFGIWIYVKDFDSNVRDSGPNL